MKCIKINKTLFDVKRSESHGLISALAQLQSCGFKIIVDNYKSIDNTVLHVIENEGVIIDDSIDDGCKNTVDVNNSDNSGESRVVVNNEHAYVNILEAVSYICSKQRTAVNQRTTKETDIEIALNLDGEGSSDVETGIGFFDHMLDQISRHGNIDIKIKVNGDLHVDEHHTVEDVGIAFGETVLAALGDKSGIKRYGFFLPMDDTIAKVAMDIGGRQYLNFKCNFKREFVGEFPTELTEEFFKGVAQGMKANIYIRAKGKNDHHKIEAIFKAFAKSLNEACRYDERAKGKLPTTKGII